MVDRPTPLVPPIPSIPPIPPTGPAPPIPSRPTLAGARVVLRPGRPADVEPLVAIAAEESVRRWWGPQPREEIEEKVLGVAVTDEGVFLTIEADGRVVGGIQYADSDSPEFRYAGIDIFLATAAQGRGLGREAIRVLARHLFEVEGHHRLTIDPAAANAAAIRCYESVGFRAVGVMRQYQRLADGAWHDGLLLDLLRDELIDA